MNRSLPRILLLATLLALSSGAGCLAAIDSVKALPNNDYQLDANRTLRINCGQFIVHISGKRDDQAFIVTPSVVARSNDADLIVQVSPRRCRISVLSGTVTIKNVVEKHIFTLERGSAYETLLTRNAAADIVAVPPRTPATAFEAIVDKNSCLPAYQTSKARTVLYRLSAAALKDSRFAPMLDDKQLQALPAHQTPQAHIVSPPTVLSYDIGARLADCMPIPPQLVQHFPPSGIMPQETADELVAEGDEMAR